MGDRYAKPGSDAQLTVVSTDELAHAEALLGLVIAPGATRRNITIQGFAIPQAKGSRLRLGDVLVEVTGPADPCRLMETCVGPGAMKALAGRAGVRARVLKGGLLGVGASAEITAAAASEHES